MTTEQANFWARLWEIHNNIKRLVDEFDKISETKEIIIKFPLARSVYMHELIILLWMILGNGRSDKFTLSKLENLFKNKELKNKVSVIINGHKELIGKIGKNRNKISAHLDPQLTEMLFSNDHIDKYEKQFEIKAIQLRALDKTNERYTPEDIKNDLPEIRRILNDVEDVWQSLTKISES